MMNVKTAFIWIVAINFVICGAAFAAGAKTYQVTGTVVESTPTMIAVQKGTERWEIDIDPQTKGAGDLKVGNEVTITYVMSASKVDATAGLIKFGTPATASTP
jgi:type 1 fimbria pilin